MRLFVTNPRPMDCFNTVLPMSSEDALFWRLRNQRKPNEAKEKSS